jgi:2-iminobutanoate/2-iminopropanoate deaminase
METQMFNTPNVPRSNTVFPQAVIAGNLIFLSGTTGVDPQTGKLIEGGYEQQLVQTFRNIKTILDDAGSSMDKIIKTTVFMVAGVDPDFSVINKVYSNVFPVSAPARSAPQVMPFPGGILVSVECIALI